MYSGEGSARVSLERCEEPLNYQTSLRAFDSSRNTALEPTSVSCRIAVWVNLFSYELIARCCSEHSIDCTTILWTVATQGPEKERKP